VEVALPNNFEVRAVKSDPGGGVAIYSGKAIYFRFPPDSQLEEEANQLAGAKLSVEEYVEVLPSRLVPDLIRGVSAARDGNFNDAVKYLSKDQKAWNLDFIPEAQVGAIRAKADARRMRDETMKLLLVGDLAQAQARFREVESLDPG